VEIYDALLGSGDTVTYALPSGRKSWVRDRAKKATQ
jgi:hypothetical protein